MLVVYLCLTSRVGMSLDQTLLWVFVWMMPNVMHSSNIYITTIYDSFLSLVVRKTVGISAFSLAASNITQPQLSVSYQALLIVIDGDMHHWMMVLTMDLYCSLFAVKC